MKKSIYFDCKKSELVKKLAEPVPDSSVHLFDVLGRLFAECGVIVSFRTYTPVKDESLTEVIFEEVRDDDAK